MRVEAGFKPAFIVACATLLAGAVGFRAVALAVNAFLLKEPAPLREPLGTIPSTLGSWKSIGADSQLDDAMIEALGTKFYLNRVLALDGDPAKGLLQMHIAFYTGLIDRVPHVPERCFVAGGMVQVGNPRVVPIALDRSGWRMGDGPINLATGLRYPTATVKDPVTRVEREVHLPLGDAAMTIIEFQDPASPNTRILGGYLFVANGQITPRAGDIRSLSYSLTERYAYFAKVQFTGFFRNGDDSFTEYEKQVTEVLREILPHLMLRLPDWPEYEARSARKDPTTH